MCKAEEICEKPFVVIQCLAYNHQPYIRQCLDGFIMQKTDFPFIAVIHDDASTDGTAEVVKEYEKKYPAIIKGIYQKENQYKTNPEAIGNSIRPFLTGKYIAMCEGDDYWTDPFKLQKQVDFLEANPDYGLVYAKVRYYEQKLNRFIKVFGAPCKDFNSLLFSLPMQTLSLCCRRSLMMSYFKEGIHLKGWKMGDYPMILYFALHSKLGFINEIVGVYRILPNSASHSPDALKNYDFNRNFISVAQYFVSNYVTEKKQELLQALDLSIYWNMLHYSSIYRVDELYKRLCTSRSIIFTFPRSFKRSILLLCCKNHLSFLMCGYLWRIKMKFSNGGYFFL